MVGTMIEVPSAALTADEIAKEAEFFSFGTNDLTQMTFGYSRDDSGSFLPEYIIGHLRHLSNRDWHARHRVAVGFANSRGRPIGLLQSLQTPNSPSESLSSAILTSLTRQ